MNKKHKIIAIIVCAALISLIGGSYAVFINSTDTTKAVSTSKLGITLVQTNDTNKSTAVTTETGTKIGLNYGNVMPGSVINESMAVKADADSKTSYVRVTATRYWTDKDGNKVTQSDNADKTFLDPSLIKINTKNASSHWYVKEDAEDAERIYFYYKLPLAAGVTTDNLMDSFTIDSSLSSNKYSGYSSHIEFFAEGVQQTAGKDAMLAEWGVNVTLDDSGNITEIVEQ